MLAAHWSELQYELALFATAPRRLVLIASPKVHEQARQEESVVSGFVVVRIIDQEWEIENIVVDANWRRLGIAR
ncbi:MAG: hypothetical protein JWO91_1905, partial [Acidobacteriaceae bacterium]|nr:hypothetical protein [Acidobacteriaceae bacterium]